MANQSYQKNGNPLFPIRLVDNGDGTYSEGVAVGAGPTVFNSSTMVHAQVGMTTGAALVLAANANRLFVEVKNIDASIVIYLGKDASVTAANGLPLAAGVAFDFEGYTGDIYGIAASGTPKVAYLGY